MKVYMVQSKSVTIHTGKVQLDSDQARRRSNFIKLDGNSRDVYQVQLPCQFKKGEMFGYDGVVTRAMGEEIAPVVKTKK